MSGSAPSWTARELVTRQTGGPLNGTEDLDGRFVHNDEQVEQWLEEFRHRCQVPRPDGT
jgi:hypothetical protein